MAALSLFLAMHSHRTFSCSVGVWLVYVGMAIEMVPFNLEGNGASVGLEEMDEIGLSLFGLQRGIGGISME